MAQPPQTPNGCAAPQKPLKRGTKPHTLLMTNNVKKIQAVIIDDNINAIKSLKLLIEIHCNAVKVIGTASCIEGAIELINSTAPDLVFLDIELGNRLSFEILNQVSNHNFQIICVTGFLTHSIKAISYNVSGYILKPVAAEELKENVSRVLSIKQGKDPSSFLEKEHEHLLIPDHMGHRRLLVKDITFIEADASYVTVHCVYPLPPITCTKSLNYFERVLNNKGFHRTHRKYLVSLKHISSIQKSLSKTTVTLSGNIQIPVSVRQKKLLFDKLHSTSLNGKDAEGSNNHLEGKN